MNLKPSLYIGTNKGQTDLGHVGKVWPVAIHNEFVTHPPLLALIVDCLMMDITSVKKVESLFSGSSALSFQC